MEFRPRAARQQGHQHDGRPGREDRRQPRPVDEGQALLKITGVTKELDQATIDRARHLAGLERYVTNLPTATMDGAAVIAAYHDLWHVEQSLRMTDSDRQTQPVFHHQREAIEAHLTVVFAALAVARHLQDLTGMSIKKIVQALRTARSATIEINGQRGSSQSRV